MLLTLCHPGNLDSFNLQSDKELPLVVVFEADTAESLHTLCRTEKAKTPGVSFLCFQDFLVFDYMF